MHVRSCKTTDAALPARIDFSPVGGGVLFVAGFRLPTRGASTAETRIPAISGCNVHGLARTAALGIKSCSPAMMQGCDYLGRHAPSRGALVPVAAAPPFPGWRADAPKSSPDGFREYPFFLLLQQQKFGRIAVTFLRALSSTWIWCSMLIVIRVRSLIPRFSNTIGN